jgi:hypothetical protein
MKRILAAGKIAVLLWAAATGFGHSQNHPQAARAYLGFDRNDYPGDAALPALRKTFRYTSYWLNNPPGEIRNSWTGKRPTLRQYGFGFLVLFTGRTDSAIKAAMATGLSAEQLGAEDGKAAAAAAVHEGFPKNVLIFLDQEEGGRLLPQQAAYLFAWVDAVRAAGARPGVYCSGIEMNDSSGTVSTALDIAEREQYRNTKSAGNAAHALDGRGARLSLWIANDQCPPSPGCTFTAPPLTLGAPENLSRFAAVWQYAQSPRRAQFSASCPANQAPDRNCYAPGLPADARVFVDLNTANSPDPSGGSF